MNISKGRKQLPHLILIHGKDGVGKSTLASEFPDPLFIGPESGTYNITDASRVEDLKTWSDTLGAIGEVLKLDKSSYKTIVIDSLDWLQKIITKFICQAHSVDSIELARGGYGKGYRDLEDNFLRLIEGIKMLRASGRHVVLICHSAVSQFNDPATDEAYNRYELKLYKDKANNIDCRALFREFVDAVIYLQHEVFTQGEKGKARAQSTHRVLMQLQPDARWDAKNRFGVDEPLVYKIGQGFKVLNKALSAGSSNERKN